MARLLWFAVGALLTLTLVGFVALWPTGDSIDGEWSELAADVIHADIQSVVVDGCSFDETVSCRVITGSVTEGQRAGEVFEIEQDPDGIGKRPEVGDEILVTIAESSDGTVLFAFYDYERSRSLIAIGILFVAAVVVLGRWRGIGALVGMAASVVVIVAFMIPSILQGHDAILVALVAGTFIAIVALFLAHGLNVATVIALLSSCAAMVLTVVLAHVFVRLGRLTGFADEDTLFLTALDAPVDPRGLLLAGILIGSLGVLDDVTVTQVSVAWELRRLDPSADWYVIYQRAIRVGRDHISSTVNTLFLAYAGASLSLLLLFARTGRSLVSVATSEVVATEIVRALVGSIGLVAAVPVATGLAAYVLRGVDDGTSAVRRYPRPTIRRPPMES